MIRPHPFVFRYKTNSSSLKILFAILLLLAPLLQGAHATSAIEESMNLYYPDDRLRKILGESPQFRSFEEEEACEVSDGEVVLM